MFKYIIFETSDGRHAVRMFDVITDHSQVVREVGLKVVSAGKLFTGWQCVNGSVTLGLKYNAEQSIQDTKALEVLYNVGL